METFQYYIKRYIEEFFQAFIAVSLVKYITDKKPTKIKEVILFSFYIGTITFILEEYDKSYAQNVKNGIRITAGSTLLKAL